MKTQNQQDTWRSKSDEAGIRALFETVDTALTRLSVAGTAASEEERRHNYAAGKLAYEAAIESLSGAPLTEAERSDLDAKLYQLRVRIEGIGRAVGET
jgi:hypothetical protein